MRREVTIFYRENKRESLRTRTGGKGLSRDRGRLIGKRDEGTRGKAKEEEVAGKAEMKY